MIPWPWGPMVAFALVAGWRYWKFRRELSQRPPYIDGD